jgi:hypothetical protein
MIDAVNFKVQREDRERLDSISERLSLPRSEVARRALRLGLAKFEKLSIPGSITGATRVDTTESRG